MIFSKLSIFLSFAQLMCIIVFLGTLLPSVSAFEATIELAPGQKRCLGEQLSKHVLIVAEFRVTQGEGTIYVTAMDPFTADPVFQQGKKRSVHTAFTSTYAGTHMFCVQSQGTSSLIIDLSIVWGPEARDYSLIAKAEHLDDVLLQLRKLEDRLRLYHANVLFMRDREAKTREAGDAAANRLITFCAFNMILLIITAASSAYYFKKFFRSKKII